MNLATILLNIFLFEMNFNKYIIGLHFLLISFIFAKFLEIKLNINNYVIYETCIYDVAMILQI